MQTFLPYEIFSESALALDKKRCWKQVVEAKQIIEVLELYSHTGDEYLPRINHPAVRMWDSWIGHVGNKEYYLGSYSYPIYLRRAEVNNFL